MNERYYSLQLLRGIAAWMVSYHHYMQLFYNFEYKSFIGLFFSSYGSFGVDIFFVLSGFVMFLSASNSQVNAYSFFINRLFRVAPIYWFYTLAMIVFIKIFPAEFSFTDYNFMSLLASLAFYPHNNPSGIGVFPLHTIGWTLNFEMAFYTIFSASLFLSKRRAWIICSIVLLLLPYLWPSYFTLSQVLGSTQLHEFLGGIIVAAAITSSWFRRLNNYTIVMCVAAIVSGLLCFKFFHLHPYVKLISATLIVFSTALINKYIETNNTLISFFIKVGDYSYSTYLIHVFILGIALHYIGNQLSEFSETTTIIGISIILYVASKYSYIALEQNRYLLSLKQRLFALVNRS